jgi:hypothetical protein
MQVAPNPTAAAFGAQVSALQSGRGMCLIIGHRSPEVSIKTVGGQLVAMLPGHRAIAIVDIRNLAQLQQHEDVKLAGPISVDPGRFQAFQRLVGLVA